MKNVTFPRLIFQEGALASSQLRGASQGYSIGARSTYSRIPFLVGSYSQLDQIFEGRLIPRATKASPLARTASEPAVRYRYM